MLFGTEFLSLKNVKNRAKCISTSQATTHSVLCVQLAHMQNKPASTAPARTALLGPMPLQRELHNARWPAQVTMSQAVAWLQNCSVPLAPLQKALET